MSENVAVSENRGSQKPGETTSIPQLFVANVCVSHITTLEKEQSIVAKQKMEQAVAIPMKDEHSKFVWDLN